MEEAKPLNTIKTAILEIANSADGSKGSVQF
jgi:hypothetical protein